MGFVSSSLWSKVTSLKGIISYRRRSVISRRVELEHEIAVEKSVGKCWRRGRGGCLLCRSHGWHEPSRGQPNVESMWSDRLQGRLMFSQEDDYGDRILKHLMVRDELAMKDGEEYERMTGGWRGLDWFWALDEYKALESWISDQSVMPPTSKSFSCICHHNQIIIMYTSYL